jgi:hypothetical protein
MPDCRYIVLSHHFTETSERGQPLVLLLEYVPGDGSKQRKSYLLSDLTQATADMLPAVWEWIISLLSDISKEQCDPHLSTDEMFYSYSHLNVGPVRTTCSGSFACSSLSEAFASIKDSVMSATQSSSDDRCFPDLLLPLDPVTLRSIWAQRRAILNRDSEKFRTSGIFERGV